MEIFEKLPDEINHLVSEFSSTPVVGDLSCGITQYSFWLIVSTIVLLIVLAVFKKKQTLVPKGFFVNGFEYIIEYVENARTIAISGHTNPDGDACYIMQFILMLICT